MIFSTKNLSKDKTHFLLTLPDQTYPVHARVMEFEGLGFACYWPDVVALTSLGRGMRYWQTIYNVLSELEQIGLPAPWPEVFYSESKWKPPPEFWAHFEELDGYLLPRDFDASVGALVSTSTNPQGSNSNE